MVENFYRLLDCKAMEAIKTKDADIINKYAGIY